MMERLCRSPLYQFRASKNGEVRRHGVLGDFDKTRQFAGGHTLGLAGDEQTECLQPRRLGERGHGGYHFDIIHMSSLPDIQILARSSGRERENTSQKEPRIVRRLPPCTRARALVFLLV